MITRHIALLAAEIGKLRRSLSWSVVVGLPLLMVFSAVFASLGSDQGLADGWHTLWMRSMVFHGLFPLTMGIGILAALVWRPEHRGGNWNALLASPVSCARIVWSKITVIAALAALMQMVMVLAVVVVGKAMFDLPGTLPARYFAVSVLLMVAMMPSAALQSGLSMIMRSFAAPVAVAVLGAGLALVLSIMETPVAIHLLPQGLVARTTQLGTGTFADSGTLTASAVLPVLGAGLVMTLFIGLVSTRHLDRGEVGA